MEIKARSLFSVITVVLIFSLITTFIHLFSSFFQRNIEYPPEEPIPVF